jgi:hypothetical protein
MRDRSIRLLDIYDLYIDNLQMMLQSGPDKEILEAVRKLLKDEGINAEVADRKDSVKDVVSIVEGLPLFEPEDL